MTNVLKKEKFLCCRFIGLVLLVMLYPKFSSAKQNGSVVSGSVLAKLFSDYDQVVRPGYGGDAIEIFADLYVESFGNIQEVNMEFKVFGYLRQQWKDGRLSGKLNKTLTIKGETIGRMWLPDPFCYNARDSNLMQPDSEVHSKVSIDVHGNVHYTKGVTFLASCEMDLRHFPFDSQECFLKIGSYAYSTEDIIYKWKYQEVEVEAKSMAQFDYCSASLSSSFDMYKTGNFSTITVAYYFKRRMGYYLIQVYFPDICVVALSWIVFWMDKNDMGNRMALGITTILTIMFLLGSLNGTLPRVSYPKALDWYLLVSFSFAFLSLVECMIVFVVWLSSNKRKAKKEKEDSSNSKSPSTVKVTFHGGKHDTRIDDKESHVCLPNIDGIVKEDTSFLGHEKSPKLYDAADLIDKFSRALFPMVFLIFNIGYWCYYSLA
ncbi:gamma-aminobutyric acid receptor subunit rho-3-like isoform X1 [Pocillopora damicornis]|uniref:gamma-aminobutyric acid receptor subunit rho-3-like isoform X1 n=1 Tax=Pocillopora damicornis TaxID=46731 RepID=UPI000F556993|nr:gamma-aminobutyric acid receptor subunit rho-3-like isoform X1 [Pocillopora damicornis]XP_027060018.1 gamma-aminobutyric acid receptor subunit rho-3-like isoform X1 [Pocillopora damicornis]XP_027060019.1 gamma-aminobutyric acid receptor subunit rho-3-like isoform X1 [Pocillopora damicornis]